MPALRYAIATTLVVACHGGAHDDANGWANRPLEPVSGHVGLEGRGALDYTIQLPHGLGVEPGRASGMIIAYEANIEGRPAGTDPSLELAFVPSPPTSLKQVVDQAKYNAGDEVVRQDELPGGYLVSMRTFRTHWRVEVILRGGDHAVDCVAQQGVHTGEPMEASRTLLEKICTSLTVTPSR